MVMKPPSGGPQIGPINAGMVRKRHRIEQMRACRCERSMTRRPTGVIIAPPMPCTMRAQTNCVSDCDSAQPIEPIMNTVIAARNTLRAPKRSAVQPLTGMKTASAQQIGGDRQA